MSSRWLALLLLFVSASSQAYELPIEVFEYVDDARIVAYINKSDLVGSTHWQPLKEPPPFTIENVTGALRQYIATDKKLRHAKLVEIELRRIPHHEKQWHYMVKMETKVDNETHYHYLVVLMNGKIIPAIREPESIK